jgi:hypothetical protein
MSRRPKNKIVHKSKHWLGQCRKVPESTWSWPMTIKATRAQMHPQAAAKHVTQLEAVKHTYPSQTRLRAVAATMGGGAKLRMASRFRRLARDYERLASTLAAFHFLAFACLMIANLFRLLA